MAYRQGRARRQFAIGMILGSILAVLVYRVNQPAGKHTLAWQLIDDTARRYLDAGIFSWEFVRGKLKFDLLYLELLKAGILPRAGAFAGLGLWPRYPVGPAGHRP